MITRKSTRTPQNTGKQSIALHKKHGGKLSVASRVPLKNRNDLSLAYTPGVAAVSLEIAKNPHHARTLTSAKRTVAIVSDGSAVLGLGDIGPLAALPVMEGKASLLKRFAGLDGFPIVLSERSVEGIVAAVKAIAPTFGAINLEDISAPRCFEIEERLSRELDIPVMHDDQHGTAIVVLAGLINALKLAKKDYETARIVISGAGAAGIAITKLLQAYGCTHITLVDSQGIVGSTRKDLNPAKQSLLATTNPDARCCTVDDALLGADVFIGVSKPGVLTGDMIRRMNKKPIIFALANPTPEIMPREAHKAGAFIVATGRSDFPNQINNSLAFPGVYKGLIEADAKTVTTEMKIAAARAIARAAKHLSSTSIVPSMFDDGLADTVAKAVKREVRKDRTK
jgi:malate dehydrogenase (oxaloacetate-decarboxylating)